MAVIGRCQVCGHAIELAYAGLVAGRLVVGLCLECYHAAGELRERNQLVWQLIRRFLAQTPRQGRTEYFALSVAADGRRLCQGYASAWRVRRHGQSSPGAATSPPVRPAPAVQQPCHPLLRRLPALG